MDGDALRKGAFYRDLRKSVIIFICTFDPFGENLGKYTFNNICEEKKDLALGDECTKIFINSKGIRDNLSKDLSCLMDYIESGSPQDDFTKTLNERVEILRS
ncbi:MAG: hypothetical protein Q4E17_04055, partial [Synergistes sp.]|nr:hypothetical protein [Synergistes sp.]